MNRRHFLNNPNILDRNEVTYFGNEPFTGTLFDTFDSGVVSIEIKFLNGLKHGVTKEFYESGKLKMETTYNDDLENGTEKIYSEDGFIVEISEYQNGVRVKRDSITSVIQNPLTLYLLKNLFVSFDYFTLKKDNIKLQLEFIEEDFYSDFDSLLTDMTDLTGNSRNILFSGLRSSITPYELSEEGDFEELVENPIEIPGIFGFSDNSSSKKSVYVIGNPPNIETTGSWDFRTTTEFDNIDKLITYMDENYSVIQYNQLSPEEKKRVTYIKEKRETSD